MRAHSLYVSIAMEKLRRQYFCLFVFRFYIPVNSFSVMSGWSQLFLGLTSTVGSKCVLLKDTTR